MQVDDGKGMRDEREVNRSDSSANHSTEKGTTKKGVFLPFLGLSIALLTLVFFQTSIFYMDREMIEAAKNNQHSAFEESKKARIQFESIVKGTARLAQDGNANAKIILNDLRKKGITIGKTENPPK